MITEIIIIIVINDCIRKYYYKTHTVIIMGIFNEQPSKYVTKVTVS